MEGLQICIEGAAWEEKQELERDKRTERQRALSRAISEEKKLPTQPPPVHFHLFLPSFFSSSLFSLSLPSSHHPADLYYNNQQEILNSHLTLSMETVILSKMSVVSLYLCSATTHKRDLH
jgi:hypothetical protein